MRKRLYIWLSVIALALVAGVVFGPAQRKDVPQASPEVARNEPAAAVVVDALVRLLPGALGSETSAENDSFSDGLLDCPHYTRPVEHELGAVPPVLMSGNHAEIARWRRQQALGRTWLRRPDLIDRERLPRADRALLDAFLAGGDGPGKPRNP